MKIGKFPPHDNPPHTGGPRPPHMGGPRTPFRDPSAERRRPNVSRPMVDGGMERKRPVAPLPTAPGSPITATPTARKRINVKPLQRTVDPFL